MTPNPRHWPRAERYALLAAVVGALLWSGIAPHDRLTWLLEVIWVVIGLPLVAVLWSRFPLSRLLGWLLALHALVLIYGGAHTYALTPIGLWAQEAFELSRNHYDRLGHFAQGFVPAILAREVLRRQTPLLPGGWLNYLCIAAALSFSAFFEMIEWWAALIWGGDADAFLATQGDVWDTQWDMFCALIGASVALALFSRLHERQLSWPVGPAKAGR
jgi:putative membrane protein